MFQNQLIVHEIENTKPDYTMLRVCRTKTTESGTLGPIDNNNTQIANARKYIK